MKFNDLITLSENDNTQPKEPILAGLQVAEQMSGVFIETYLWNTGVYSKTNIYYPTTMYNFIQDFLEGNTSNYFESYFKKTFEQACDIIKSGDVLVGGIYRHKNYDSFDVDIGATCLSTNPNKILEVLEKVFDTEGLYLGNKTREYNNKFSIQIRKNNQPWTQDPLID